MMQKIQKFFKKFFKPSSKKILYQTYKDVVNRAYDLSLDFTIKVNSLTSQKDSFDNRSFMGKYINSVLNDVRHNRTFDAFARCRILINYDTSFVTVKEFNSLVSDVQKLSEAVGRMEEVLKFLSCVEQRKSREVAE